MQWFVRCANGSSRSSRSYDRAHAHDEVVVHPAAQGAVDEREHAQVELDPAPGRSSGRATYSWTTSGGARRLRVDVREDRVDVVEDAEAVALVARRRLDDPGRAAVAPVPHLVREERAVPVALLARDG